MASAFHGFSLWKSLKQAFKIRIQVSKGFRNFLEFTYFCQSVQRNAVRGTNIFSGFCILLGKGILHWHSCSRKKFRHFLHRFLALHLWLLYCWVELRLRILDWVIVPFSYPSSMRRKVYLPVNTMMYFLEYIAKDTPVPLFVKIRVIYRRNSNGTSTFIMEILFLKLLGLSQKRPQK